MMSNLQSAILKFVSKGHTYECARLIVRYFENTSKDKKIIDNVYQMSLPKNKGIQCRVSSLFGVTNTNKLFEKIVKLQ